MLAEGAYSVTVGLSRCLSLVPIVLISFVFLHDVALVAWE